MLLRRVRAFERAAELASARDIQALGRMVIHDERSVARSEAARALGTLHDRCAVAPLVSALRNDQDADVRRAAARSLGVLGDSRAVQSLVHALSDPDESVGMWAAQALGRLRAVEAVGPLAELTTDSSWGKRVYAVEALAALRHRSAISPLVAALSDERRVVHRAALRGVAAIADDRDLPLLGRLEKISLTRRIAICNLRHRLERSTR